MSSRKIKRILIWIFSGILLLWMLIILGGFHFYTSAIPIKIPWILILLLGLILRLSVVNKGSKIAVNIIFPIILLIYIPAAWLFNMEIEGDLKVIECKECDKQVISYFHQGLWGGTPLETTGIGQTYVGGLIYKTERDTTYFAEYEFAEDAAAQIHLPEDVQPKDLVFVWKREKILLVYSNNEGGVCYPLVYK